MRTTKTVKTGKRRGKTPLKKVCLACPPNKAEKSIRSFYKSNSPMHQDGYVPWCKNCIVDNSTGKQGEIDEEKFKNVLRQIDKPFYIDYLQSAVKEVSNEILGKGVATIEDVKYQGAKIIGRYMKNIQSLPQLADKSYKDSEKDNFSFDRRSKVRNISEELLKDVIREEKDKETVWNEDDEKKKRFVLSVIGYDPFEDIALSESDRKYGFNILSGYCDTEGISEDGHKIQSVIEISVLYIQVRKITEALNKELAEFDVSESRIKNLTTAKSTLLSSIATIAKDNNIASNYNKNSRQGKDSLTSKMKEMEENGFREIQVNLFDIKTSEAFRQIDEISNSNIAKQLSLDNNEYSEMVKEQREIIIKYRETIESLEEKNRKLENTIIDLENNN